MLVESAWSYRKPARIGDEMGARMPQLTEPGHVEMPWKARGARCCGRFRRGLREEERVATAIARELVGFTWA